MKRKEFIKKTMATGVSVLTVPTLIKAEQNTASISRVGFNHLPNKEYKTMNTVLHKSSSRGQVNHGWLNARHSFSFANYYNPDRMNFGVLRVLNDDVISGGNGFGLHPHENMEIISIPLDGALAHKDNMGNESVIKSGDIQVMSAGTGIMHSEFNHSADADVKLLQIWLDPKTKNVMPRYDQITLDAKKVKNKMHQILSPNKEDDGVWIHQNAWFHLGNIDKGKQVNYTLKDAKNGVYAFILEGEVSIENQVLNKRDGFGVWNTKEIKIITNSNSKILLLEVPMEN